MTGDPGTPEGLRAALRGSIRMAGAAAAPEPRTGRFGRVLGPVARRVGVAR